MLQLLVLSLEQKSVLLEHLHGRRGHAQRKAVVVDDHDAIQ